MSIEVERYCLICGNKFIAEYEEKRTCGSIECVNKHTDQIRAFVDERFIEAIPQALETLGLESIEEYPEWKRKQNMTYVYFIKCDDVVKIGYAKDVKKRLAGLQTSHPKKLELIGYIEGDLNKEKQLHELFDDYRLSGEWFTLSSEILDYISQLSLITTT